MSRHEQLQLLQPHCGGRGRRSSSGVAPERRVCLRLVIHPSTDPVERQQFVRETRAREAAQMEEYRRGLHAAPAAATFAAGGGARSTGIFHQQPYLRPRATVMPGTQAHHSKRFPRPQQMFPIVEPSVVTTAATTGPSASLCPATGPLAPLHQMETNNAPLAEPLDASSMTGGKKPRINWVGGELDENLAVQVYASGTHKAPHGRVTKAWPEVAATLSTLPCFLVYGGLKADAAKKRYSELMGKYRADSKNPSCPVPGQA